MRIYRYPLEVTDRQTIHLPYNSKILTAQLQHDSLQLWAMVDELENLSMPTTIAIYGTGNPMPDRPGEYISTFQMHGGNLVFHVFNLTAEMSGRL